jgi:hypothetical protein
LSNVSTEVAEILEDYWKEGFMPFPPRSLADVRWFGETFLHLFEDPVGLGFTAIAAMVFLIGCAAIFSEKQQRGLILLSPLFFALLASGFRKYSFNGRLLLFLIPAIFILVASQLSSYLSRKVCTKYLARLTVSLAS